MIIIGLASGTEMSALTVSLGVFAVAAYKIVPSVNRIVNSWVEYKRNAFAAEKIAETFADAPQIRFDVARPDASPSSGKSRWTMSPSVTSPKGKRYWTVSR